MKHLKKFETTTAYNAAILDLPNVSLIEENMSVAYNPYVEPIETRVVAKFNVTDTSKSTQLCDDNSVNQFSAIEIDGVAQPSIVSAYTFITTGEHVVKYTLTDPTTIVNSAFEDCGSITSITIPNSVTTIGNNSFRTCSGLTSIEIPTGVTSIGNYAFAYCSSLSNINIPSSVVTIGYYAFDECSGLTSANIQGGSIGEVAFQYCEGLTTVIIGSGVTNIDSYAFIDCNSLISVTVNATTPPTAGDSVFFNNASGRKIYVPSESVATYKATSGWSTYANDIEAIPSE